MLVYPHHDGYDRLRQVWNGLVDRRPAVIAYCARTSDIVEAIGLAVEHKLAISIRAGGHQVAGSAVCDGGLMIDLSPMRDIRVDPVARTVRVGPGVTWHELTARTQRYGLIVPGGEVGSTGVAGMTLGGGIGYLTRAYGLSCDSLRGVELATADGTVHAAPPELMWAVRGCGRGLGVVTALEFDLHPLGPDVAVSHVVYPYSQAGCVIRAWQEAVLAAPVTVTPQLVLRHMGGERTVSVGCVYAGPPRESEQTLAPFRRLATPLRDLSTVTAYAEPPPGDDADVRGYMKSHFLNELTDAAVAALLEVDACRVTSATIAIRALGGAVRDFGPEHSAFPHRDAAFNLNVHAVWHDPALDEAVIGWCRAAWEALRPHASGGVYINFPGFGDDVDLDAIYGASAAPLHKLRAVHDPNGVFAWAARCP